MESTVEAKKLLASLAVTGLDNIYTVNLPKEMQDNTDKTVALITDVSTQLSDFGNDTFYSREDLIELQIFHKLKPRYSLSEFEKEILKGFFSAHWSITEIKAKTYDPDTQQLSWAIYLKKQKEL
ncbi:DUF806 family protein [Streptococcus ferus]|uniref:DUF806 family protein n=1 Tax=Streptococcus ferus TaxID=1345 RepID=UPI0035178126